MCAHEEPDYIGNKSTPAATPCVEFILLNALPAIHCKAQLANRSSTYITKKSKGKQALVVIDYATGDATRGAVWRELQPAPYHITQLRTESTSFSGSICSFFRPCLRASLGLFFMPNIIVFCGSYGLWCRFVCDWEWRLCDCTKAQLFALFISTQGSQRGTNMCHRTHIRPQECFIQHCF